MIIRVMQHGDYAALIDLWQSFPGNTITGADSEEGFHSFLDRNGKYCFTAEKDGFAAGSVMAGEDSRRGYIYHLSVREDLQGSGTGSRLMEQAENALFTAGIEKVHLFIYSDNPAIEFYKRTGWHLRDDIEVMSKVLRGETYAGTRRPT